MVVCAHIDSRGGTPGALDNGTGVAVLLLLAELLRGYRGPLGVELLAVNGEDYYAASGELDYLARNQGRMGEIALAVNLDAAGYREGRTAWSLYGVPDELAAAVRREFARWPELMEGEPWYQSDHMVFAQNGVPAVAITSEHFPGGAGALLPRAGGHAGAGRPRPSWWRRRGRCGGSSTPWPGRDGPWPVSVAVSSLPAK